MHPELQWNGLGLQIRVFKVTVLRPLHAYLLQYHLNQMLELTLRHATIMFGRGLIMSHSFHSGVLEKGCKASESCRIVAFKDWSWSPLVLDHSVRQSPLFFTF